MWDQSEAMRNGGRQEGAVSVAERDGGDFARGMGAAGDMELLQRVGFDGEEGEWDEYGRWLGLRHARRIRGEMMSNAMAIWVEVVRCRERSQQKRGKSDVRDGLMERPSTWAGIYATDFVGTRSHLRSKYACAAVRRSPERRVFGLL